MEPRDERILHRYLEGQLSADESREFLARMQDDPDFKTRLEGIAKAAPTSAWNPESPRYQSYGWGEVQTARSGQPKKPRRWAFMFLFVMIALFGFQIASNGTAKTKGPDLDDMARLALNSGVAHLIYPHGEHLDRPRVFEMLVPKGTTNVVLRVRADGVTVFEREARAGAPGVDFEPRGERSLHAVQILVPFPSKEELPLESGRSYDWMALPSGSRWSAPATFKARQ